MRKAWYIARKELLQTRRDRLAYLFSVVLPLVFTVFLGLLMSSFSNGSLPLALSDLDGGPAAEELLRRLRTEPVLAVQIMSPQELEEAVQEQRVAAGLVIPRDYSSAWADGDSVPLTFVRLETSSGAQSVYQAVQEAVSQMNVERWAAGSAAEQVGATLGVPVAELRTPAARLAEALLRTPAVATAVTTGRTTGSGGPSGFDQASTGSLVNWVLFGLLGVAGGMAWERRQGLLLRLKTMRVGGPQIIAGKMMAMILLSFLQQLLLILVGRLAFGVAYFGSPVALFLVMISLSVLAASLGLLIASLFRSEQAVVATTVITALLLAALGGAWFPLEITHAAFNRVAHVLPTAWLMDALHGIVLNGWGLAEVLPPLGFVWMWSVVFFGLAVWRYRPS